MMKKIKYICEKCGKATFLSYSPSDPILEDTHCVWCDGKACRDYNINVTIDKEPETVSFAIERMKWAKGRN